MRRGSGLAQICPKGCGGGHGRGTGCASRRWALPLGLSQCWCWCWQEPKEAQEAQCSKVQRIGEDPQSYYFPGQFAFIRGNA